MYIIISFFFILAIIHLQFSTTFTLTSFSFSSHIHIRLLCPFFTFFFYLYNKKRHPINPFFESLSTHFSSFVWSFNTSKRKEKKKVNLVIEKKIFWQEEKKIQPRQKKKKCDFLLNRLREFGLPLASFFFFFLLSITFLPFGQAPQ